MQQEAAHELAGLERHRLVARGTLDAVVLPAEGDAALVERDEAAVGDGHAVRVARQIGQHGLGPGKRPLGVDDPLALAQGLEPLGEGRGVGQCGVLAEEPQQLGGVSVGELFE